jgi:hypothetical protein
MNNSSNDRPFMNEKWWIRLGCTIVRRGPVSQGPAYGSHGALGTTVNNNGNNNIVLTCCLTSGPDVHCTNVVLICITGQ